MEGDEDEKTLAVNAAIMDGDYEPQNAPWLISLELPRSSWALCNVWYVSREF